MTFDPFAEFRMAGHVALVTGGAQNIGAAIARTMAAAGAQVAIADLNGARAKETASAIEAETGVTPELSTTGGTSDARFLSKLCPVVEFGLCNATMHKLDEAVAVADLSTLRDIYAAVVKCVLG